MRPYDKSTGQGAYAYSPLKGRSVPLTRHYAEISNAWNAGQIIQMHSKQLRPPCSAWWNPMHTVVAMVATVCAESSPRTLHES
jgi:hypothetical protein